MLRAVRDAEKREKRAREEGGQLYPHPMLGDGGWGVVPVPAWSWRPLRAGEWRETAGAEASRETEPLAKRRRVTSGRVGILRQLAEASGQLELFDSVARMAHFDSRTYAKRPKVRCEEGADVSGVT